MVRTVVNSKDGEHLDMRPYHSKQFDINCRVVITKVLETISAVTQLQQVFKFLLKMEEPAP